VGSSSLGSSAFFPWLNVLMASMRMFLPMLLVSPFKKRTASFLETPYDIQKERGGKMQH
jgi:hypothetical protein